jgi:hypothetical protein
MRRKKDRLGSQIYPVYADMAGKTLDFYYSYMDRKWYMRYQKDGKTIKVKLFDRGRNLNNDFEVASNRAAVEARRRNMRLAIMEIRG